MFESGQIFLIDTNGVETIEMLLEKDEDTRRWHTIILFIQAKCVQFHQPGDRDTLNENFLHKNIRLA